MTEAASERQKLYLLKKASMIELNAGLAVRPTTLISWLWDSSGATTTCKDVDCWRSRSSQISSAISFKHSIWGYFSLWSIDQLVSCSNCEEVVTANNPPLQKDTGFDVEAPRYHELAPRRSRSSDSWDEVEFQRYSCLYCYRFPVWAVCVGIQGHMRAERHVDIFDWTI